jgi:hypothetical protein
MLGGVARQYLLAYPMMRGRFSGKRLGQGRCTRLPKNLVRGISVIRYSEEAYK